VLAGERSRRLHQLPRRPLEDHAAAFAPALGTEVDDMIGAADDVEVVFSRAPRISMYSVTDSA
jgi:hypothetical protein